MSVLEDLTIGRGMLYLNLFGNGSYTTGDGERYIGNTPGFSLSYSEDATERWGSVGGRRVMLDRLVTRQEYTGTVVCDQISKENAALWFGGHDTTTSIAAITSNVNETIVVKKGFSYQIGVTDSNPIGVRFLHDMVFKLGVTVLDTDSNFIVSPEDGRFQVKGNAPDVHDNDGITVRYQADSYKQTNLINPQALRGSLRFISTNPFGSLTDAFFPLVSIEPTGTFEWKTDDWAKVQFSLHVMRQGGKDLFYTSRFAKT